MSNHTIESVPKGQNADENHAEFVLHTGYPLPGLKSLGSSLYNEDLRNIMKGGLTMKTLVAFINDMMHWDDDKRIIEKNVVELEICPDDHAIWRVEIEAEHIHPSEALSNVMPQSHVDVDGNPLSHDQGLISMNATLGDPEDQLIKQPTFNLTRMTKVEDEDLPENSPEMSVGLIEQISHNPDNFSSEQGTHADAVAKIISSKFVKPVSIPMRMPKSGQIPTVFDLICTLSQKSNIDKVQVVNISQGFTNLQSHSVLARVLADIDKPIICSAGNARRNNDNEPNWPANFSRSLPHVISITAFEDGGPQYWNYGEESVTACAPGTWTSNDQQDSIKPLDNIKGTSFAAAWISRMYATAFSKEKRSNMDLHEVFHTVSDIYHVDDNYDQVQTLRELKFTREEPRPQSDQTDDHDDH